MTAVRILQVAHALPAASYGGTELYTEWLAEALAEDHEVAVATPRGADTAVEGASVHWLPDDDGWVDRTGAESGLERDLSADEVDRAFGALLNAVDPDVVHFQHLKFASATLPQVCAEHDVPSLLTLHDFWTICHRERLQRPDGKPCSGPESLGKCAACYADALTRTGAREDGDVAVDGGEPRGDGDGAGSSAGDATGSPAGDGATGDGPAGDGASGPAGEDAAGGEATGSGAADGESNGSLGGGCSGAVVDPDDVRAEVATRKQALRAAREAVDLLVAPSSFLRERFVAFGTDEDRIVQRRPGVRTDEYLDTGYDPHGTLRLGYAGRITPEKGVHVLVEAFETLDGDATLDVFGAFEPEDDEYHEQLRSVAGEDVEFHGRYGSNALPFRRSDVLVVPSLWYENSPLVIQEALAAGVPVVAGDAGGMAELVSHGRNGLTYPVGDPVALAECLQALVNAPTAVERLRSGVEEPKSLAEHVDELERLYVACASGGPSRRGDLGLQS